MYWRHLNLTAEPFSLSPDPAFLYLSPVHAEAFAAITMGLRERRGVMTMIGEVGTGKTTLVYSLLSGLGPDFHTAYISNARLSFDGILRSALQDFDVPCEGSDRVSLLDSFNQFLHRCANEGTTAVLVVDEAQNLSYETFEDLRLLSNFETYRHKLLQIVLVGQPELDTKLRDPALRQVAERVAVRCNVNPLTLAQARQYIDHRLRAVNGSITLFTKPALRLLISRSRGIPRSINILCHNALLFAYGEGKTRVTRAVVRGAVREKQGRGLVRFDKGTRARIASGVGIAGGSFSSGKSWAAAAVLAVACGVLGLRYAVSAVPLWTNPVVETPVASQAAPANTPEPTRDRSRIDRRRQATLAPPSDKASDVAASAPAAVSETDPTESEAPDATSTAAKLSPAATQDSVAAPVHEAKAEVALTEPPAPASPVRLEPADPAPPSSRPEPVASQGPVVSRPPAGEPVPSADQAAADKALAVTNAASDQLAPSPQIVPASSAQPSDSESPAPVAAIQELPAIEAPSAVQPAATAEARVAAAASQQQIPDANVIPRVVKVPAGSSLSKLMLSIYGEYTPQLIDQVKAVNPQVSDPDLIIAGDHLRFPDTSNFDLPPSQRP